MRDVADGMFRLAAAAAAVIALGARKEAVCSSRGLAEGHGFAVKGGAGVAGLNLAQVSSLLAISY